jgi:superfamily II DNA or RNA helicase
VLNKVNGCIGGCLVLANRVEYLQKMQKQYIAKSVCLSGAGNSKKAKEERKEALRKLNAGEIQCVFATYQLAKEGLDVPNLRYVVFATPEKDETTVIQSAGRVGRKADGKQFGTVIDFVDNFAMFKGWYKKRCGYYKKIDAEVSE